MRIKSAFALAVAAASVASISSGAQAAAFTNGSFEFNTCGTAPNSFTTVAPANACITGWTTLAHSVDLVREDFWQAQEGEYSVDLSGNAAGGIQQAFDTVAGGIYSVDYFLAGNPDAPAGSPGSDPLKFGVVAAVDGVVIDSSTILGVAATRQNMQYQAWNFTFTAQGPSTTLRFTSNFDNGAYGPVLDNVSVTAVPEPATWAFMLVGFGAVGYSMRRRSGTQRMPQMV